MSLFSSLNIQLGRCMKYLVSSQIPLCIYSIWKPIILTCQYLVNQLEQEHGIRDQTRNTFFELIALLEAARYVPAPCSIRTYIAEVVQLVDRFMVPHSFWEAEAPKVKALLTEPTQHQRLIGVLGTEIFLQAPLHACLQPEHDILHFMVAFKQFYHAMARAKLIVEGLGQPLTTSDIENLFEKRAAYMAYVERGAPRLKEILGVDKIPFLSFHIEAVPIPEEQKNHTVHFVPPLTEEMYHEQLSIIEAILTALGRDDFRVLGVNAFVGNDWEVSISSDVRWAQGVGPIQAGVAGLLPRHEPFFVRSPPWPIPAGIVDFTACRDLAASGEPVLVSACCGVPSVVFQADVGVNAGNGLGGGAAVREQLQISRRAQLERNRQRSNFTLGKWVTRWNFNASRGQKRFFVHDPKTFLAAHASAIHLRHEVEQKFASSRTESSIKCLPDDYSSGFWVAINYDEYTAAQALTYFSVDAYGADFARSLAAKCCAMTKLTYKRPSTCVNTTNFPTIEQVHSAIPNTHSLTPHGKMNRPGGQPQGQQHGAQPGMPQDMPQQQQQQPQMMNSYLQTQQQMMMMQNPQFMGMHHHPHPLGHHQFVSDLGDMEDSQQQLKRQRNQL